MSCHLCVVGGWDYFKELTDQDVRKRLYEEQKNQIEQDMKTFGFLNDGLDEGSVVNSEGDRWTTSPTMDEYGNTLEWLDSLGLLMDLDEQLRTQSSFSDR